MFVDGQVEYINYTDACMKNYRGHQKNIKV